MAAEYPIDQVKRARNALLRGGTEEETRWAFDHLVGVVGIPESYDGRLPAAAAESLLKSDLSALPEESLRKLAGMLRDTTTGIALFKIADLLVLLPRERVLKHLPSAQGKPDLTKHLHNAASIAYVQAMHGDAQARSFLISLARQSEKVPGGYLQSQYVRVLRHFPGSDGEADWYFREGYRLWVPPELFTKIDTSSVSRTLEMIRLPKNKFIVQKCRTDFGVKDARTGITYLRPPGSFLMEYSAYPGWEDLASDQQLAVSRLVSELTNEEKSIPARTLAGLYHLELDGFALEQLLLGWLSDPAPFRLFT